MGGEEIFIWTCGDVTKDMVDQICQCKRGHLLSATIVGTFVRYGPRKLLVNSNHGLQGTKSFHCNDSYCVELNPDG